MKIYFSPFSPFVRKCLVVAHEVGLADRIELLPSNAHPIRRDGEILQSNPLGQVPTFFTDDGMPLYDSRVICEYLDSLAGGGVVFPQGNARWDALKLQALGDGMLDGALLARYERAARPEEFQWDTWYKAQLDKVETSLAWLDANAQMLDARVDIGAITIGCVLWYLDLRFGHCGWRTRYPRLAAWDAAFAQRPSMSMSWSL